MELKEYNYIFKLILILLLHIITNINIMFTFLNN